MRSHENERQQVKIIDKVPVVGEDPLEQIKKNAMQLLSSIHEQDYQKENWIKRVFQSLCKSQIKIRKKLCIRMK